MARPVSSWAAAPSAASGSGTKAAACASRAEAAAASRAAAGEGATASEGEGLSEGVSERARLGVSVPGNDAARDPGRALPPSVRPLGARRMETGRMTAWAAQTLLGPRQGDTATKVAKRKRLTMGFFMVRL